MIIELFDSNGQSITTVTGVENPEAEFEADYRERFGAASWQPWVLPDDIRIRRKRAKVIAAIKFVALEKIQTEVSALDSFSMVDLLRELWPMLDASQASAELLHVKDIAIYAKTVLAMAASATEAELDAYDPITDPNWP